MAQGASSLGNSLAVSLSPDTIKQLQQKLEGLSARKSAHDAFGDAFNNVLTSFAGTPKVQSTPAIGVSKTLGNISSGFSSSFGSPGGAAQALGSGAGQQTRISASQAFGQPMGQPFGGSVNDVFGSGSLGSSYSAADLQSRFTTPSTTGTTGTGSTTAGGATGQKVGSIASFAGGNFDQATDQLIQQTADKYGIPPDFLKTIITKESSGDWANNSHSVASVRGGQRIFGYIGAFDDALYSWGVTDLDALEGNQALQIDALGKGLSHFYQLAKQANPSYNWLNVASYHFSGQWEPASWTDEMGQSSANYVNDVENWWRQLDAAAGNTWSADPTGSGTGGNVGQNPDGSLTSGINYSHNGVGDGSAPANGVIAAAQQYIGVPYVWGSEPGKGSDPTQTGWDCSGLTYWLDQNYGTGTLPQGSHYQYQQAVDQGKLFTDQSQLQPGDLVYFDTENGTEVDAGNTASHVAVYIGNGQIIHAANPSDGTLISDFTGDYYQTRFIGAEHMSWSGGGGTTAPTNILSNLAQGGGSGLASLKNIFMQRFGSNSGYSSRNIFGMPG